MKKYAVFGGLILAALAVAYAVVTAYPVLMLVAAVSVGGAYLARDRKLGVLAVFACAAGVSAALAALASIPGALEAHMHHTAAVPLFPASWFGGPVAGPNRAGRLGLVVGSLVGLAVAWSMRDGGGKDRNDENHVHGLRVVKNAAKGTSRWAGDRDVAHVCEFGPPKEGPYGGGVVLGRLKGRIVRAQPSKGIPPLPAHVMVVAGTGAGKSYSYVIPNAVAAAMEGQSIVVTDPKGELACTLAPWLRQRGYDVYVFNLGQPEYGDRWNPVLECRDDEEITAFTTAIVQNAAKDSSGYFVMKEIQLLKSLVYLLRADFPPEQAHLRSALSLLAWPKEELDARFEQAYREGRLPRTGYEDWRGAVSSNFENAQSGLTAKLGVVRAEPVAKLLAGTPGDMIDLSALGRKKAALFCVLPIGAGHLKPVLATFYYFFFRRLYQLAAEHGGKLPVSTRFLLDEFANIGQVPGFSEVLATARSLGIQVQFVLQGLKQLTDVYGAAEQEIIASNCPVQLFLGGDDMTTLKYFSVKLGDAAVIGETASREVSTPWHRATEMTRRREGVTKRPLMEPEEMQQMDPMAAIAVLRWCLPMYLRKVGWTELPQAKEIQTVAVQNIAQVVPAREFELQLPPIPEPADEPPPEPDRRRTRSGGGKGPSIDDLFGGTPDFS